MNELNLQVTITHQSTHANHLSNIIKFSYQNMTFEEY